MGKFKENCPSAEFLLLLKSFRKRVRAIVYSVGDWLLP